MLIKQIVGYEGKYEISDAGEVWALNYHRENRRAILKSSLDKDGYLQIGLRKYGQRKWFRVHRLVASAFLPNLHNLKQVNHKDGNKKNNDISNLEWSSASQNIKHSFEVLGKNQKGSKNNYSKIDESIVSAIWRLKGVKKQTDIAKEFNITDDMVSMIHRQKTWKWFTDEL